MKQNIKKLNAKVDSQIFNWQSHKMPKAGEVIRFGTICAIRNRTLRELVV
jgi:hypothetical protein